MSFKILIPLLAVAACCAQQAATPNPVVAAQTKSAAERPTPNQIKIVVIAGEGAANNVTAKVAAQPAVEVRDENDRPVPGAEVVFELPPSGPGGVFFGWLRTNTVRTDAQGQARVSGLTPNEEMGRFQIKVRATAGTKTAEALINQSNTPGPGKEMKSSKKGLWTAIAIIAAGGITAGIVAATRNGDSTSSTTAVPVTISAGPITVGGPR